MYLIGTLLSFALLVRMTGKHRVFGKVDMDAIMAIMLVSFGWPVTVPIALAYWHLKNNEVLS